MSLLILRNLLKTFGGLVAMNSVSTAKARPRRLPMEMC